jgi:hypothetical protein
MRGELKEAVGERYRTVDDSGAPPDLGGVRLVTGYHRKHAVRVLN